VRTFYLIDGHAQLFRAYYAPFRPLTSPSGESVKAVYVFTQMLLNVLGKERPDYLAIAFDVSDETTLRRHAMLGGTSIQGIRWRKDLE
jgi:DNA polymerase I